MHTRPITHEARASERQSFAGWALPFVPVGGIGATGTAAACSQRQLVHRSLLLCPERGTAAPPMTGA